MSDCYQLALPLGSNNTNFFVYVFLCLRSSSTKYYISRTKHFVTGASLLSEDFSTAFFYKQSQNKTTRVKLVKK